LGRSRIRNRNPATVISTRDMRSRAR
jgi:hypothetical protein